MRPTAILMSEHRVIEQVLGCLEAIVDRALGKRRLDVDSARQALDFFAAFADAYHHRKEERHLFPALEAKGFPRAGGPTGVMRDEHEQGRAHLRAMATALDRVETGHGEAARHFAEHARAYARLLREHIWEEDHRLFPIADRALTDEEQQDLAEFFAAVEGREVGAGTHEQFLRLADELADRCGVPRALEGAEPEHACGSCGQRALRSSDLLLDLPPGAAGALCLEKWFGR
jgi:hemerythrin-like domain-containing protein